MHQLKQVGADIAVALDGNIDGLRTHEAAEKGIAKIKIE